MLKRDRFDAIMCTVRLMHKRVHACNALLHAREHSTHYTRFARNNIESNVASWQRSLQLVTCVVYPREFLPIRKEELFLSPLSSLFAKNCPLKAHIKVDSDDANVVIGRTSREF